MPQTVSTVSSLPRDLAVADHETVDDAMRRVDRAETDAICRHLLGELLPLGAPAGRR